MTSVSLTTERLAVRVLLILVALVFIGIFVIMPVVIVFTEALANSFRGYFDALESEDARSAIKLTLLIAAIAVPCNLVFGLAASWAITKFDFIGKKLLITLIDLPFSVSPVISGLIFVMLFGANSVLSGFLERHHLQIVFAVPGLVIATIFVTFPFVARELIPLMEQQGRSDEEAAIMLGATGWQTFWKVTLPNIKWGLFYGVLLCNARAMGEFGAVSVISGHIEGVTTTIPLQVEVLYNEYNFVAAFAVASILTLLALFTLMAKSYIEYSISRENKAKG